MRRVAPIVAAIIALIAGVFFTTQLRTEVTATSDFTHFEAAHVHPAALSPSGDRLFVVNTPDMRLSVFSLTSGSPVLEKEILVGLEPVSVAAWTDDLVWVVNHLSDNISIVDIAAGHVVRTLRTGDEPSDVVFAGSGGNQRAFVCVSQEDAIKVFDPGNLDAAPDSIAIDGSDPRALAVNGDSSQVYVTILESGSQTTIVHFQEVLALWGAPAPNPPMAPGLPPAPNVGLIVKWDGNKWADELDRNWNLVTPHRVHDKDLFILNANTRTVVDAARTVGTTNFNAAWNPGNGMVYVTNADARNEVRFEPNLQGNLVRTRVTRINPLSASVIDAVDINPHINYAVTPGPQGEIDQSLAIPTDIAWKNAGDKGYIAALGSDLVGVIGSAGNVLNRIPVGGGPSGLAIDESRNQLYVVNRFDNTVSIVNLLSETVSEVVPIGRSGFDPTPADVKDGRRFLYDAKLTSGHGDVACASCHVFANFDALAWDLGDPLGDFMETTDPDYPPGQLDPLLEGYHPMKGPMMTQSLRGIQATPPFHWRGDHLLFNRFNPAFVSLLGNDRVLTQQEFDKYEAFIMSIQYPPNPNMNLDRTFPDPPTGPSALRGFQTFFADQHDGPFNCVNCHDLDTGASTSGQVINDQALQEDQDMLVPHLRNMYEKVGFADTAGAENKLGYGYTHDGVSDNLFNFVSLPVFQFDSDDQKRDIVEFLLAFDTGMHPLVGYQLTVDDDNKNDPDVIAILNMMKLAALDGPLGIDLIAKGLVNGEHRGYAMNIDATFRSDRVGEGNFTLDQLRLLAANGGEITFSGLPVGSGGRAGVDRDRDTWRDRDEIDYGTDPADPNSYPGAVAVGPGLTHGLSFAGAVPNPFPSTTDLRFTLPRSGDVRLVIYDLRGREVRVVADGPFAAGPHQLHFDGRDKNGRDLAAGIYFSRLEYAGSTEHKTLVLLR